MVLSLIHMGINPAATPPVRKEPNPLPIKDAAHTHKAREGLTEKTTEKAERRALDILAMLPDPPGSFSSLAVAAAMREQLKRKAHKHAASPCGGRYSQKSAACYARRLARRGYIVKIGVNSRREDGGALYRKADQYAGKQEGKA